MIVVRSRTESEELIVFRLINARKNLTDEEKKSYNRLEKGFAGELQFDSMIEKNLSTERYILNDLLFKKNNSTFQIDSFVISQDVLHHFEVKNNEGDHYFESDNFYSLNGNEIQNPLLQMNRGATLLRQLLRGIGCNLPLISHVVFVNPGFMLYQAPRNEPIIYLPQIPHFFRNMNQKPSKLNSMHKNLAEKLLSLHITENPYKKFPDYSYEELEKGILCKRCWSFMLPVGEQRLRCTKCGCEEKLVSGVIRSVNELRLLFPGKRITTNVVFEWCKVIESKKTIRRVLNQNYTQLGYGKWVYFE